MAEEHDDEKKWDRTHFKVVPDKRLNIDRRKMNCFIENDRRSGVGCRRKVKQIKKDRQQALSKVTFHPEYFKID
jgi:hypothetical protein